MLVLEPRGLTIDEANPALCCKLLMMRSQVFKVLGGLSLAR